MDTNTNLIRSVYGEIDDILRNGLVKFWLNNGIDERHGGYYTCFDADGKHLPEPEKYLVTQTRMLWATAALSAEYPGTTDLRNAATHGFVFLVKNFWDEARGGWYWKTSESGECLDNGKVVYGQSFAVYALAAYAARTGNKEARELAERTFELLQIYAADTEYGGYLENLEPDWSQSKPGFQAGDRKSLDIHMHLMEAFTALAACTGKEIHRRKLAEVVEIIVTRMIDPETGAGLNQFDRSFKSVPPINIRRTWNTERKTGEAEATKPSETSYGHNLEIVWLMNWALAVLGGGRSAYYPSFRRLADHALSNGFDDEYGGIYRDGPLKGKAANTDKEWWQNCEALVGFLCAYEIFRDTRYLDAFFKTWSFIKRFMYNEHAGEFRQLVARTGEVKVGDVGNPWKALYHSGRALMECKRRLSELM